MPGAAEVPSGEPNGTTPVALLSYASGSLATGVFSTVPTVLLLFYCTETLRIGAGAAAVILFAPKAWALFWDPFVGSWADRRRLGAGTRTPLLATGAVGMAAAFAALFAQPALGPAAAAAWTGVAYLALATLYSLFAVPYVAIPAEVGRTTGERSRLVSWRMTFAMLGVLAGAGLAPALVQAFGGGRGGYAGMGLALALICAVAMTPSVLAFGRRSGPARPSGDARSQARSLLAALRIAPFRALVAAYLLQLTAVGIVSSAAPYVITRTLHRGEGDVGLALAAMVLVATVSIPAWSWLAGRSGELRALVAAALAYAVAAAGLGAVAMGIAGWAATLAVFALAGASFGGLQVLPFTLMAHVAAGEGGAGGAGAMAGAWTASEKLGLALGPAATALALGFGEGARGSGFHAFLLLGPALLAAASLIPLAGLRIPAQTGEAAP